MYLTDDPKAQHWADAGDDHRFVRLDTFLSDCESAWKAFVADVRGDATLRAYVVEVCKYRLHDTTGDDLGVIERPAAKSAGRAANSVTRRISCGEIEAMARAIWG